nr:MAG TPA: hypothetical protein [Caudoviricetes sp.]
MFSQTIYRKIDSEMIRHFFLDKTNSIFEGSTQNIGLNPVLHVAYGVGRVRGLIHFDIEQIKCLVDDKTFANLDKLSFNLKMTNYFSIDSFPYEKNIVRGLTATAHRAASFDLMLFKLPCEWDKGRGFDYIGDFWIRNRASYSQEGSNWYFAKNGIPWEKDAIDLNDPDLNWAAILKDLKGGIYSKEFIEEEYQKYLNGEESIVITTQHFDFGNENLSMDITNYVKELLDNPNENYGLCLAFIPRLENTETEFQQYVGFVDDNTNTFFHPYVEAIYDEYIMDDRESFTVGKDNNLYLYVFDDENPVNLDEIPSCRIDEVEGDVRQVSKGVYCAHFKASDCKMEEGIILSDKWSKIALNGVSEDDIELEFSTRPKSHKIKIGSDSYMKNMTVPSLYGINDDEKIQIGDIREVTVDFRKKYTTDIKELISSADYRLYVKDGNRQYDVLHWQPVEKGFLNNFFVIYTQDLVPNEYYIDIRVSSGRELKYFNNVLKFTIVSNVTERYQ